MKKEIITPAGKAILTMENDLKEVRNVTDVRRLDYSHRKSFNERLDGL